MAQTLEIVRFTVDPENETEFLAGRDEALDAIAAAFPGMIGANLGRLGTDLWVDVVLWESMEDATRAAEGCFDIPAFKKWSDYITEVVSMEHATIAAAWGRVGV